MPLANVPRQWGTHKVQHGRAVVERDDPNLS